ncbi:MAG TPA: LuxR C-terminal-related transcriptional regulator [Streptosporangiaceae bacterium]|nr:LuxR C-terminal-related transcriptional regulator [Streptosporangiaceae bacterium]
MPTVFEPAADAGNMVAARTTFRRDAARAAVVSRPALWERLDQSARVTAVSAPPGSGKTVLLRSWIDAAGLAERAAWVSVERDERDPQRFWLAVLDALRQTAPGSGLIRELTPAPDLDGWAIVERLLKDLAPLDERLWLVIDDLHELGSSEARRQLELLLMRAPAELRFVLATRHDLRLGLHRLRLEGELAEIRAGDLRFTVAEARVLFVAAGVQLPDPALAVLYDRTEGWAAGLRLAALSLTGHPDRERFAEEFSGSERTVAEYLLAEVLERQPREVRRLLLRTSVLERVNGELADLLAGGSGGERVLQDLEEANAFVVALDAARSWFRYHHLFADLLQLKLRCSVPDEVAALHRTAATWLAGHGFGVEAVRQAQAARDWELGARLLADHWPGLWLDGQAATIHELVAGFPAGARAADAELAAVAAADELAQGSLEAAERYLALAERGLEGAAPTTSGRRGQAQILLGVVRLLLAWYRGDLPAEAEQARRLRALFEARDAARDDLAPAAQYDLAPAARASRGEELRALALIGLGDTEIWTGRLDLAESHMDQAVALARRIGQPYLEFTGLAYRAVGELSRSFPRAAERGRQAIELAERHGWTDETTAGLAYMALGSALAWQGRAEEAEPWVQRAERTIRPEISPVSAMGVQYVRGQVELVCGRAADAVAAFRAAERLAGQLPAPHPLAWPIRAWLVHALVRLDDPEQVLAGLGERVRDRGEIRIAVAVLRLAEDDPQAAIAALAPVLDGSARVGWRSWLVEAFLLEAIARDALGDPSASGRAAERALDLAEADGALSWFLLHPAPGLLARQARQGTAHAALIAEILGLLSGNTPAPRGAGPRPLLNPLSKSELRVLRYLPTHLSAPEIAGELYVSPATVKTHLRNLYAKLGVHSRTGAVEAARALGLLAPSPQRG